MRILAGIFALFFSFSLACDADYDEVMGVKIGCPASDQLNLIKEEEGSFVLRNPGFFDFGFVIIDNDIVEGLIFNKAYDLTYQNQFKVGGIFIDDLNGLVSSLNERWGRFYSHSDAKKNLGRAAEDIKNGHFDVSAKERIIALKARYVRSVEVVLYSELPLGDKKNRRADLTVLYLSKSLEDARKEAEKDKYSGL